MPNWVFNDLTIEGNPTMVQMLKDKMNQPFEVPVESHGDLSFNVKQVKYSNPVFAFWNIINPFDMGITAEEYATQPMRSELEVDDPNWWSDTNNIRVKDKSWYNWNITNWGTKWDVAVSDDEKYPDTELVYEDENGENLVLVYKFQTAWGIPEEAMITLSKKFPTLLFTLSFEEETGWGGEIEFLRGNGTVLSDYGWCCRNCGHQEAETPYCEECEYDTCPKCGYGEPDEMCEKHKELNNVGRL